MRIAVVNNSGNVGKSTITQNMLLIENPDFEILRVESINSDGKATGEKMTADDMMKVFKKIMGSDDIIVDVGSSNIEAFMYKMEHDFAGACDYFDYFIVPVTPDLKQQNDTVSIINALVEMGVDEEKIKIIFNKINTKLPIHEQFTTILESAALKSLGIDLSDIPALPMAEVLKAIEEADISYNDYLKIDKKALRAAIKETSDPNERDKLVSMEVFKLGVDSFAKKAKKAYDKLNIE